MNPYTIEERIDDLLRAGGDITVHLPRGGYVRLLWLNGEYAVAAALIKRGRTYQVTRGQEFADALKAFQDEARTLLFADNFAMLPDDDDPTPLPPPVVDLRGGEAQP